jgi:hypothetical protein
VSNEKKNIGMNNKEAEEAKGELSWHASLHYKYHVDETASVLISRRNYLTSDFIIKSGVLSWY